MPSCKPYPNTTQLLWTAAGLLLLTVIRNTTVAMQVPAHQRLSRGYDRAMHLHLVRGNWIRTAAWSLRLLLLLFA